MDILGIQLSEKAERIITCVTENSKKKIKYSNTNNGAFKVITDNPDFFDVQIDVAYAGKYFECVLLHEVCHIWQSNNGYPQFGHEVSLNSLQMDFGTKIHSFFLDLGVDAKLHELGYMLHPVSRNGEELAKKYIYQPNLNKDMRRMLVFILLHMKYYNTGKEFKRTIQSINDDKIKEYYADIYTFINSNGYSTAEQVKECYQKVIDVFGCDDMYGILQNNS